MSQNRKILYVNGVYSVYVDLHEDIEKGTSFFTVGIEEEGMFGSGKKLPPIRAVYQPKWLFKICGITIDHLLQSTIDTQIKRIEKIVKKQKKLIAMAESETQLNQRTFDKLANIDDNGIKKAQYTHHKHGLKK